MIIVEIAGHLGADAEERFTANGKRVISLRMATRVGKTETVWWRVNIWGDKYDKMLPYLRKGTGLIIIGDMGKPETYVAKDGTTQVSLTLNAEMVKFSPFGKPERPAEPSSHSTGSFAAAPQEEFAMHGAMGQSGDFAGDDLPF